MRTSDKNQESSHYTVNDYDITDFNSIFEYSKGLLNNKLRQFVWDGYKIPDGKGDMGKMIENIYFHLRTNSRPQADFSEAGLELKSTPLKKSVHDEYLIKERMSCNIIDYMTLIDEDFDHSHFYQKCKLLLIIFYLYQKGYSKLDLKFIYTVLWSFPKKDLLIIKHDYETIVEKVREGNAHLLSEGDTLYLAAARKGNKGDKLRSQPNSDIGAPQRCFALKKAYMRLLLDYVKKSKKQAVANIVIKDRELVSETDLENKSFEDIILDRFTPYLGYDYKLIAKEKGRDLSRNPKNKFAIVANSIAYKSQHGNINMSEEFKKAGLTMKTICIRASGLVKESMSFENINYIEIETCKKWFDSRLYEIFSSRFLFVVFREQHQGQEDFVLDDVFFWTMPQKDLNQAEKYWKSIRKNVIDRKIDEDHMWSIKDNKKFHVRPKAKKSKDLGVTADGGTAKKFCYWFNNNYVRKILKQRKMGI